MLMTLRSITSFVRLQMTLVGAFTAQVSAFYCIRLTLFLTLCCPIIRTVHDGYHMKHLAKHTCRLEAYIVVFNSDTRKLNRYNDICSCVLIEANSFFKHHIAYALTASHCVEAEQGAVSAGFDQRWSLFRVSKLRLEKKAMKNGAAGRLQVLLGKAPNRDEFTSRTLERTRSSSLEEDYTVGTNDFSGRLHAVSLEENGRDTTLIYRHDRKGRQKGALFGSDIAVLAISVTDHFRQMLQIGVFAPTPLVDPKLVQSLTKNTKLYSGLIIAGGYGVCSEYTCSKEQASPSDEARFATFKVTGAWKSYLKSEKHERDQKERNEHQPCESTDPSAFPVDNKTAVLCYNPYPIGSSRMQCKGDSGGPIFIETPVKYLNEHAEPRFMLLGIMSRSVCESGIELYMIEDGITVEEPWGLGFTVSKSDMFSWIQKRLPSRKLFNLRRSGHKMLK